MLRTRKRAAKRAAKRHIIRHNKTHNKRHTFLRTKSHKRHASLRAKSHNKRRTLRRVHQNGGFMKGIMEQFKNTRKRIQGFITPEKEEEVKRVHKTLTSSNLAPVTNKISTDSTLINKGPAIRPGAAQNHIHLSGGFSLGTLKGHLNNAKKAAEKHTAAITAAVAPQIKSTASTLQKHVTNATKAVESHPLTTHASQQLKQFQSTAAKHINEGTAASHKAFISANTALQHKVTNLQPHISTLTMQGKSLAAKGAKKAKSALGKAQSAQASLLGLI